MTSKIVVNNIESDSGISSVTFTSDIELGTKNLKGHNLESTGIVTAVSFTGSGANLTNLPAGNLSGALPAISGANLTGINTAFGSGTSVNTTGIITATSFVSDTALSHRNLIVNGAMNVVQRGQVTGVTDGFGGPDRFRFQSNYSTVTMSQSTDVPSGQGFAKSLKLDVTTAGGDSNASTYTQIDYRFEGQDLIRLKYGTSSAETTTLCFWIKSPKAGIHWVRLYGDELSASSGSAFISRKYTVSSANTWQKVTLSFPGYTSDGFNNDNTTGMRISWYFAQGSAYSSGTAQADDGGWLDWGDAADRARNSVGQVNCFDSTSNDIFLTGVQFEVGPVATPFEHRSFGEELSLCERYFEICATGQVMLIESTNSGYVEIPLIFRTKKRTNPTMTLISSDENFVSSVTVVTGNTTGKPYQAGIRGNNIVATGNKYLYGVASASAEL